MYFTNGATRGYEKMMTAIPKFKKKGHGMSIAKRFIHTPITVDCGLCTKFRQKKCRLNRCLYLTEKIEASAVSYKTLITDCFADIDHIAFKRRLPHVHDRICPSLYADIEHIKRFALTKSYKNMRISNTPPHILAATFLLTSSFYLFSRCETEICKNKIGFENVGLRGIATNEYIIYQAAKTIYTGEASITLDDLGDRMVVSDTEFRIIVTACLIAKYGVEVLTLEKYLKDNSNKRYS